MNLPNYLKKHTKGVGEGNRQLLENILPFQKTYIKFPSCISATLTHTHDLKRKRTWHAQTLQSLEIKSFEII